MQENLWTRFDDIAKPEEVESAKSSFTPIDAGRYVGGSRKRLKLVKVSKELQC